MCSTPREKGLGGNPVMRNARARQHRALHARTRGSSALEMLLMDWHVVFQSFPKRNKSSQRRAKRRHHRGLTLSSVREAFDLRKNSERTLENYPLYAMVF